MLRQTIRSYTRLLVLVFLLLAVAEACHTVATENKDDDLRSIIPTFIKDSVYLFAGNKFSAAKASLGRYLFYDRRMSVNQSKACASCHAPSFSFTDGYRRSIGAMGDNVQHNAPALINIIFEKYLTAADSTLHFPEQQVNNPMFHISPVELGWKSNEQLITSRLRKDSLYSRQLPLLFPDSPDPFNVQNIQDCITDFVKSIVSFNSAYDRFTYYKDSTALSATQKRGMKLFFSPSLHCSNCHGGTNFSTPSITDATGNKAYYQNTGLYNIDGKGMYPVTDQGLYELTRQPADMGKYKIPTLRNLAFTEPYFHDGTAASLEAVIAHYETGGRINF